VVTDATVEVQALAKAHMDRQAIEKLEVVLESCDASCKPMLHLLGSLFALNRIDAQSGWYLQHSYFSAKKSRAIHAEIPRLCKALRPHVAELIAAFGINESLIDAPIANGMQGLLDANAYGKVMGYD
jgi:acyl-CoA oxidase